MTQEEVITTKKISLMGFHLIQSSLERGEALQGQLAQWSDSHRKLLEALGMESDGSEQVLNDGTVVKVAIPGTGHFPGAVPPAESSKAPDPIVIPPAEVSDASASSGS